MRDSEKKVVKMRTEIKANLKSYLLRPKASGNSTNKKIENRELPFEFRYKFKDMNLYDYLTITEILDTPEYPIVIKDGKKTVSESPLKQQNRTADFLKSLYQKTILHLSSLTAIQISNTALFEYCLELLNESFLSASEQEEELEESDKIFSEPNYENWDFYRWVLMENFISNGFEYKRDTGEVVIISGLHILLPFVYGEEYQQMESVQARIKHFLYDMPLSKSMVLFKTQTKEIQEIKKNHPYLYSGGSTVTNKNVNTHHHNKNFGWSETLRSLATNSTTFGTYKETKESNLMEVLEYLNINTAYISASNKDSKKQ